MHARGRAAACACAVLALLGACAPAAQDAPREVTGASGGLPAPTPTSTSTSTTAPPVLAPVVDPAGPGPADVGRSTFTVTDPERDGRSLEVDLWYPAAPGAVADASSYRLPGDVALRGRALGEPPAAEGSFPLVVFSHGGAGLRFQSLSLAEDLASHGFVVAAPDHAGDTVADQIAGRRAGFDDIAVDRPLDVSLVVDRVLERSATPADLLAGRVGAGPVGVVGHSLGGFTALAAAGGTDSVPADDRVGAIVPIAPTSSLLSDDNLEAVRAPTLLIGGTADLANPIDDFVLRPFEELGSDVVRRVDVLDAAHWSFSDICRLEATLVYGRVSPVVERPFAANALDACSDDAVPAEEVDELLGRYVIAFLQVHLVGDQRYAPFLDRIDGVEVHVR